MSESLTVLARDHHGDGSCDGSADGSANDTGVFEANGFGDNRCYQCSQSSRQDDREVRPLHGEILQLLLDAMARKDRGSHRSEWFVLRRSRRRGGRRSDRKFFENARYRPWGGHAWPLHGLDTVRFETFAGGRRAFGRVPEGFA